MDTSVSTALRSQHNNGHFLYLLFYILYLLFLYLYLYLYLYLLAPTALFETQALARCFIESNKPRLQTIFYDCIFHTLMKWLHTFNVLNGILI